ncbi:MAG: N-acetyltransferase [Rhodospirillales bacterium]|nr:N-acetyltransferase [Rhodospirillales bacterium]
MVTYSSDFSSDIDRIVDLFADTFSDSEGADEGQLIGGLARDLMVKTPNDDLMVFSAFEDKVLLGTIMFSRLIFLEDLREMFILSPVAVARHHQGKGVGTGLLNYGLQELRALGIDIVLTYGDPNYYARVGFTQVDPQSVQPPLPLSQPEGWLGQSLTHYLIGKVAGPSRCVEALDNPDYW